MVLTEKHGDLFTAPPEFFFAHCISGDYALGAGIAKTFNAKFNMRKKLNTMYPVALKKDTSALAWRIFNQMDCYKAPSYHNYFGRALLVDKVFNLVTKDRYWEKPTYHSLRLTLIDMKWQCIAKHITKIATPRLGCGLDRLNWEYVKTLLEEVFSDMDIEIVVYSLS